MWTDQNVKIRMQPKTTNRVLPNLWKELVRIGISLVRMYTVYMYIAQIFVHAHREHCKPWCLLYFALLYTSWWDRSNSKTLPKKSIHLAVPIVFRRVVFQRQRCQCATGGSPCHWADSARAWSPAHIVQKGPKSDWLILIIHFDCIQNHSPKNI